MNTVVELHKEPRPESQFPKRGIINAQTSRGITKDTAEKFKVETLFTAEGEAYATSFPVYDFEDKFVAQKVKHLDKKMYWLYDGQTRPKHQMFGQHLFPKGGKYLTITEGEEDCEAAYQMLRQASPNFDCPVISLSYGAGTAEKECKEHWEYINSFENIILAFDGDAAGKKAAEAVSKLFHYKPKIMLFDEQTKDSNDYLKAKREKDWINLWWRAERVTPKGVLTFNALWDSMTKTDNDLVVELPWKGLQDMIHGLRTGRFYIFKAKPKIGKSQLFKEMAFHIHKTTEYASGMIMLEETKKSLGLGMCALEMNRPIMFPDVPYTLEELQKAHLDIAKEERLVIFDPEDSKTVENIMSKILYFVKAHNCKYIFLDHISMLAYQAGEFDERRFLDKLLADLKSLTTQLDICICAITHVNDEGETRGSRAFAQLCDFLISLHRDKLSPDKITSNTTEIIVEENRLTGQSGTACHLYFDPETGRMTELDADLKMETFDK